MPSAKEAHDYWVAYHAKATQDGRDDDAEMAKHKVDEAKREINAEQKRNEGWEAPRELPDAPAAPAWSADLMPDVLAPWSKDVSERMQAPPDYHGVSAVMACIVATGRRCMIRPKKRDDWTVVPNTFGALVGPPAEMKSPTMWDAFSLLSQIEDEAEEAWTDLDEEVAKARIKKARDALKKLRVDGDASPKEMEEAQADLEKELADYDEKRPTRYQARDTTPEALQDLLRDNPMGVAIIRDELWGLITTFAKAGYEAVRPLLLEAWNGDKNISVDRVKEDRKRVKIRKACVSLFGAIQPGRYQVLVEQARGTGSTQGHHADGLLSRIQLLVYPEPMPPSDELVDREPDFEARDAAMAAFRRLVSITKESVNGHEDLDQEGVYLRFAPDAQPLFDKWLKAHRKREKNPDLHPMMAEHLTKYRSLCPSLALVFHLVDVGSGPVGLASLQRALRWMVYLEAHAERCFSSLLKPEVVAGKLILKRIRDGHLSEGFTAREVYNRGWSGLGDATVVTGAIHYLEDLGWVKTEEQGRTKKSLKVYPHPDLTGEPAEKETHDED